MDRQPVPTIPNDVIYASSVSMVSCDCTASGPSWEYPSNVTPASRLFPHVKQVMDQSLIVPFYWQTHPHWSNAHSKYGSRIRDGKIVPCTSGLCTRNHIMDRKCSALTIGFVWWGKMHRLAVMKHSPTSRQIHRNCLGVVHPITRIQ